MVWLYCQVQNFDLHGYENLGMWAIGVFLPPDVWGCTTDDKWCKTVEPLPQNAFTFPHFQDQLQFKRSRDIHNYFPISLPKLEQKMATQTIPQTMKALLQPDPASKKVILTELPVPTPKPGSDEHLVRIHTAALTNGELLWRHNFPLAPAPENPTIFIPL
jgi:hypothetical protein